MSYGFSQKLEDFKTAIMDCSTSNLEPDGSTIIFIESHLICDTSLINALFNAHVSPEQSTYFLAFIPDLLECHTESFYEKRAIAEKRVKSAHDLLTSLSGKGSEHLNSFPIPKDDLIRNLKDLIAKDVNTYLLNIPNYLEEFSGYSNPEKAYFLWAIHSFTLYIFKEKRPTITNAVSTLPIVVEKLGPDFSDVLWAKRISKKVALSIQE